MSQHVTCWLLASVLLAQYAPRQRSILVHAGLFDIVQDVVRSRTGYVIA